MKKIVTLLFITAFLPGFAFAQGLTLDGEVKTGVFWQQIEDSRTPPKIKFGMHSQDGDSGDYEGRFRLNMDYLNEALALGFKLRIQWQSWKKSDGGYAIPDAWPYAFGYGNFFNNQLTMSIGRLGSSPWSTGGPEMWKELESLGQTGGVRFEWKPAFIPEKYGKLNIGFVLNGPEGYTDGGMPHDPTIIDFLMESVIGVSYIHDYFLFRFAYRLDSEQDIRNRGTSGKEGDDIIYRVEERIVQKYLPDFQVWALGYIQGVGADDPSFIEYKNWLFVQYAPQTYTAQLRFGYDGSADRGVLYVKPSFYYKFFDGLLEVGALFGIGWDFGVKKNTNSPYSFIEAEPKLQVNFAPGAYMAFVYNYKLEYEYSTPPPMKQTQWMNLRFGIYF
jgi:hypothetical protein